MESGIEDISLLPKSKFITEVKAERDGNVKILHSEKLGILAMHLGAGRATKEDDINHGVGIKINCKKGDSIKAGDTICYVHHDEKLTEGWLKDLHEAFVLTDDKVEVSPLIEEILK